MRLRPLRFYSDQRVAPTPEQAEEGLYHAHNDTSMWTRRHVCHRADRLGNQRKVSLDTPLRTYRDLRLDETCNRRVRRVYTRLRRVMRVC